MIAVMALLSLLSSVDLPAPRKVDSSVVRRILSSSTEDPSLPRTADWTLVGPVGDSAVLLSDGTEWRRIPWNNAVASMAAPRTSTASGWGDLVPTTGHLLEWGEPVTGGSFAIALGNGHGRSSTSLFDWTGKARYDHKVNEWLALSGGISFGQILFAPRLRPITGDSIRPAGFGFQAGACGPFACFEMERHSMPLLDHSWLQPHLDSLIEYRHKGEFWTAAVDSPFVPVWEQRLVLHLGVLEYRARWCSDLWAGPFQSLGIWNLPAGALRFGTGLEWSRQRAAVRAALSIAPVAWTLRAPGTDGVALFLEPLSISVGFRSMGEFQLTASTSVRFADPFASPAVSPSTTGVH
jgi:hypothetical protein